MLTVICEFTRRCFAVLVARQLRCEGVRHCLTGLMSRCGPPGHFRSDNVLRQEPRELDRQQISIHGKRARVTRADGAAFRSTVA
jgi:hypothetical protein